MKSEYPCKVCKSLKCQEDCQNQEARKLLDTSILREIINEMSEGIKVPFIEQILREEGLEPI